MSARDISVTYTIAIRAGRRPHPQGAGATRWRFARGLKRTGWRILARSQFLQDFHHFLIDGCRPVLPFRSLRELLAGPDANLSARPSLRPWQSPAHHRARVSARTLCG